MLALLGGATIVVVSRLRVKLLTQALDGVVYFNAPAVLGPAEFRQYEADKGLRGFEGLSECIVKATDLRLFCEIVSGFTA